jgi:S-formylglutathione hydrolase FrmB
MFAMAALLAATLDLHAQPPARGRGAGPQGRAGGPAARGPRTGTVEQIIVHGASLEGNLEGDSPDRQVSVYVPPSYAADAARRYPVLYLLHGYGGSEQTFTGNPVSLAASADTLASAQGFREMIIVTPNAYTLHKGSLYASSPTVGDWERFIAEDLVAHIDKQYRTIPDRRSRGLAGHSMGGYGALRIGAKRPDVFSALYVMSACCLAVDREYDAKALAPAEAIRTRAQAEEAAKVPGYMPSVVLAWAAAWSPNPRNPPLFLDLPTAQGTLRPDVIEQWKANSPLETLEQHVANLDAYYAIGIDIGTRDTLLAFNRELHEKMTRLHVPHGYEEYEGDHTDRIPERMRRNVLPFFSRHLLATATTPPAPQQP